MALTIGLCGPEGAGKSTVAQILQRRHGAVVRPFAAPLKKMLEAIGVPARNLYGCPADKLEPLPVLNGNSARHALQTLGTEWGRMQMGAYFWVNAWQHAVTNIRYSIVVADDVRFQSEVDAVRDRGGVVICVVKSHADFRRAPQHASENFAALLADVLIVNDGTLDQLEQQVCETIVALERAHEHRQLAADEVHAAAI